MVRIAVISGGYSQESVISARSAAMVMNNIDKSRFSPVLVKIDKESWSAQWNSTWLPIDKNDFSFTAGTEKIKFDLVFMMIHGTPGEDGILQGYFELMGLPYTTGDVLNMALTFDKAATKTALEHRGFLTAPSVLLFRDEVFSKNGIIKKVGIPCFVKPNRGGSSFGASRVDNEEDLMVAIEKAFSTGGEALIESFIEGTEVTSGVISYRGKPRSLPITEIVPHNSFFDFNAKYEGASDEVTPARINSAVYAEIQRQCERIYQLLNCRGMIRVDFLIKENTPYVMEVNTVPGFSEQSIIPQQAAVDGISKTELISIVIDSVLPAST
jgi:D-alanine-D-alanine ligase